MKTTVYFGPPGTGKTTKALQLLEGYLQKGIAPERIAFLTFSRKARAQARERMAQYGIDEKQIPYVRTIHAICYHALKLKESAILTKSNAEELMNITGIDLEDNWDAENDSPGLNYLSQNSEKMIIDRYSVSRNKIEPVSIPELAEVGTSNAKHVEWLLHTYDEYRKKYKLFDFTDFLEEFLRRRMTLPIDILIIDEAQDLSNLQWAVVYQMAQTVKELCVFGDDDQSIFTFAGANATKMLRLPNAQHVVLNKSFRLPQSIFRCSQDIIGNVKERKQKHFSCRADTGTLDKVFELDSHMFHGYERTLILYRHHYLAKKIGMTLNKMGIPFKGLFSPYKHEKEIKAIHDFFQLQAGYLITVKDALNMRSYIKSSDEPFSRIEERYRMGDMVNRQTLFLRERDWKEYFPHARYQDTIQHLIEEHGWTILAQEPKVQLSSIHQSKGGEAEQVILYPDISTRAYQSLNLHQEDNEHRVFYVAVTRAKECLRIFRNQTPRYYEVFT